MLWLQAGGIRGVLIPYWAEVLHKDTPHALQVSKRGDLFCTHLGSRVKISGKAALYLKGSITL
jgi:hypothetical protein